MFGPDTERKLALRRNQEMLKALCERMLLKDLNELMSELKTDMEKPDHKKHFPLAADEVLENSDDDDDEDDIN